MKERLKDILKNGSKKDIADALLKHWKGRNTIDIPDARTNEEVNGKLFVDERNSEISR